MYDVNIIICRFPTLIISAKLSFANYTSATGFKDRKAGAAVGATMMLR